MVWGTTSQSVSWSSGSNLDRCFSSRNAIFNMPVLCRTTQTLSRRTRTEVITNLRFTKSFVEKVLVIWRAATMSVDTSLKPSGWFMDEDAIVTSPGNSEDSNSSTFVVLPNLRESSFTR